MSFFIDDTEVIPNILKVKNPKLTIFTQHNIDKILQLSMLPKDVLSGIKIANLVFPFRVNQYVIDELIDWKNWSTDPMFKLLFPQKGMLSDKDFSDLSAAVKSSDVKKIKAQIFKIRSSLNPHPAGQMELNIPKIGGISLQGIQHKYRETVLFFPKQGQTCHSYCSFCFRWPQFVGDNNLQFSSQQADELVNYLIKNKKISDVLITGGDPLVMKASKLAIYIEAIINSPELEHIKTIRIGTKSLTFWPYRFLTDDDASDLLKLFEKVVNSGRQLAIMAHYNHWVELRSLASQSAIKKIRSTGAIIRSQGPLLRNINDSADIWSRLWSEQANLGIIPYYMFVERDTGARHWFEVPLVQAVDIYRQAKKQVSGICRTARGPSMSTEPGKVEILGVTEIHGERVFVLQFIQGRDPDWVQKPFFAKYNSTATWLDELEPAFGEKKFFFENAASHLYEKSTIE